MACTCSSWVGNGSAWGGGFSARVQHLEQLSAAKVRTKMGKYPGGRYQGPPAPSLLLPSRSGFPLLLRGVFLRQTSKNKNKTKKQLPVEAQCRSARPRMCGTGGRGLWGKQQPCTLASCWPAPTEPTVLHHPHPEAFLFPGYPSDKCMHGTVSDLLFFFSLWKRMILLYPAPAR